MAGPPVAQLFVILSLVTMLLCMGEFLFLLYVMHQRRQKAYQGDEYAAAHIVLPCYKPVVRGLVTVYFLLAVSHALTLALNNSSEITFRSVQGLGFVKLAVFLVLPFMLVQRSVSPRSFKTTGLALAIFVGFGGVLWVLTWELDSPVLQFFFIGISCGPAMIFAVLLLTGILPSRIQLKSGSNRSCVEYLLVYTVIFFTVNVCAQFDNAFRPALYLALSLCVVDLFFPLAFFRTILADTKYWRGLGQHNQGGIQYGQDVEAGIAPVPQIDVGVASQSLQEFLNEAGVLDFAYLQVKDYIGKGSTSDVYKGFYKKQEVAIKVFKPPEVTAEEVSTIAEEARLSAQLSHPNIVRFFGICVRPPQMSLVIELCRGNLRDLRRKEPELFTEDRKVQAAVDACRAVQYVHSFSMIHRDLKAENFFIAKDAFVIKLGDFGESTLRKKTDPNRNMTIVGSVTHLAPELIEGKKKYTDAVDVYSLSVVMWEVWTGEDPWTDLSTFDIYREVTENKNRPDLPEDCPPGYAAVMMAAWQPDPHMRPSAKDLADKLMAELLDEEASPSERTSKNSLIRGGGGSSRSSSKSPGGGGSGKGDRQGSRQSSGINDRPSRRRSVLDRLLPIRASKESLNRQSHSMDFRRTFSKGLRVDDPDAAADVAMRATHVGASSGSGKPKRNSASPDLGSFSGSASRDGTETSGVPDGLELAAADTVAEDAKEDEEPDTPAKSPASAGRSRGTTDVKQEFDDFDYTAPDSQKPDTPVEKHTTHPTPA